MHAQSKILYSALLYNALWWKWRDTAKSQMQQPTLLQSYDASKLSEKCQLVK